MARPLALDIDGTLTRQAGGLDERVIPMVRDWPAPVVIATGKAFPYPIALCQFLGITERVVAENGGVVAVDGWVTVASEQRRLDRLREALAAADIDLGWSSADLVNRWRESELAVHTGADRAELSRVAGPLGFEVVDSGYAYHLKDPAVTKGAGLARACDHLGIDLEAVVAIGDSENDVSTFERVGRAVAVANADEAARAAADEVLAEGYADGTLTVLDGLRSG